MEKVIEKLTKIQEELEEMYETKGLQIHHFNAYLIEFALDALEEAIINLNNIDFNRAADPEFECHKKFEVYVKGQKEKNIKVARKEYDDHYKELKRLRETKTSRACATAGIPVCKPNWDGGFEFPGVKSEDYPHIP